MPRPWLVLLVTLSGCALDRTPLLPEGDAGDPPDVPGLDAPLADTPMEDTPLPPTDRGMCAPSDDACDLRDEDCDGFVDDSACSIGATCIAFTIGSVTYQSCPPVTGIEAWSGACRRMGSGYELASFADNRDQDAVRARLESLMTGPHWVAANDFEKSSVYVWWNGSPTPELQFGDNPSDNPSHRCVAFGSDGLYREDNCDGMQRVLCAGDAEARRCVPSEEIPCNAVDEDCDGSVDEGEPACNHACSASTFWTHVYYVCAEGRDGGDEAPGDCDTGMAGARLATVDNSTELSVLGDRSPGDAWVALTQPDGNTFPTAGWRWPDTGVTFGTEAMTGVHPWSANEPNDGADNRENDQENCGLINGSDLFDDRNCDSSFPFICENSWRFPVP